MSESSKAAVLFSKIAFQHSVIKLVFAYEDLNDLTIKYSQLSSDKNNDEHAYFGRSHLGIFHEDVAINKIEMLKCSSSIKDGLLTYIDEFHADLIILGSSGSDAIGSYLGSTAAFLLRNISSDILIYIPDSVSK